MSNHTPAEFHEKARRHLFNCELRYFPVVIELYWRAFNIDSDVREASNKIIDIVRSSENYEMAYTLVCHYLDEAEKR